MITRSKSYTTEDGTTHATIEAAQSHELARLHAGGNPPDPDDFDMPKFIMEHREEILAILKSSGRKPRTKKAAKTARVDRVKAAKPTTATSA